MNADDGFEATQLALSSARYIASFDKDVPACDFSGIGQLAFLWAGVLGVEYPVVNSIAACDAVNNTSAPVDAEKSIPHADARKSNCGIQPFILYLILDRMPPSLGMPVRRSYLKPNSRISKVANKPK